MNIFKLKKINTLKMGFFMALFYGIISLMIVLPMSLFSSVSIGFGSGLFMLILIPIIYTIVGFIGGLITGALYNMISKWIGGLEFEVEDIEKFSE